MKQRGKYKNKCLRVAFIYQETCVLGSEMPGHSGEGKGNRLWKSAENPAEDKMSTSASAMLGALPHRAAEQDPMGTAGAFWVQDALSSQHGF